MEKYKTIILIEKIRKCLEEGKQQEALAIAEGIDKKKLKNMSDLSVVAESYFQNVKYEEAKKLYIRIYHKTPSRRIIAQLVHLSIKLNDIEEANLYLKEFIKIAPKDFYQYIFRYSIDKLSKAPLVKLIEDLVDLKHAEYIESWAYELAKLYHKAGLKEECVAECDDIILWFGSGDYVERAKALRAYYRGEIHIDEEPGIRKAEELNESEEATYEEEKISSTVSGNDKTEVALTSEIETATPRELEVQADREAESEVDFEVNVKGIFEDAPEDDSENESIKEYENNSEAGFETEELREYEVNSEGGFEIEEDSECEVSSVVDLEADTEADTEAAKVRELEAGSEGGLEVDQVRGLEAGSEAGLEVEQASNFENDLEVDFTEHTTERSEEDLDKSDKEDFQENNNPTTVISNKEEFEHNANIVFEEDAKIDDDFMNLESALAEQLELSFQEREKLSDKEVQISQEIKDKIIKDKHNNDGLSEELLSEIEKEFGVALADDMGTEEKQDSDVSNSDLENQVKAELRRLLKEQDLNELAATIEMEKGTTTISEDNSKLSIKSHKKINLKVLANEQLIGEQEEDLLEQLILNQVSLMDIFGNFMRMEVVRKQLVRSMDQILTQKSKNVILTGEPQSGKTRLAKCYAKWLHRMKLIQSTKIALIDGEKLNHMNLNAKKEKLKNCVIIIENAGMLSKETMKSLIELSDLYQNNIAIILEDSREKINQLLRGNSQLNSIFNNRIHLHKYTLEDYMGFAYDYITEHEYEIEMEAFIALQNEFSEFMHKKRENALQAIFSYLDEIILKSEKRSTQNLKEISQSGHYADTELMVVKREDIKS